MNELVSIIIPLYNAELFIERCVKALLEQTYRNIEIVIVNDGSKDGSEKKCDMLCQYDSRIRVLHQKNKGVSAARNAGLKVARGDLIIFCDADDYVQERYVEKLVEAAKKADFVACGYLRSKAGYNEIRYILPEKDLSINDFYFHILCSPYISGACWNKIFRKSLLDNIWFDETLAIGEDMLFVVQYLVKCKTVKYIDETLYIYCLNEKSALQNNYHNKVLNRNVCSNIEAGWKIDNILYGREKEIDDYVAYRIVRSNLWVLFQMIVCKEYDYVLGKRIKNSIRQKYEGYKNTNYGGKLQKIAVIGAKISPRMVFCFAWILNVMKPGIFEKQLV